MTPQSGKIGAAVIGYGGAFNMGKAHAEQMLLAGIDFVAACDLDPTRTAQAAVDFPGIRTYNSVDALLADPGVHLVVVILPHNLHAPIAVQAAEAGKHVVVEKPMSISVAEADAMIAASERAGKLLSVYHNRRWDGDFMTLRDAIQEGLIGEPFHLEACMGGYHAPGDWWRSRKALSGGALHDWGAHIIDWFFGIIPEEVGGVDGYFHKRKWHQSDVEDHTEAVLRFKNGATAQVEISSIAASGKSRWRILGTEGSLVLAGWDGKIEATVNHNGRMAKIAMTARESEPQRFYDNIAGALAGTEELIVRPEQTRRIIAMIEAAERSSAEGRTVVPAYA